MSSRYSGYGQMSRLLFAHFPLKNNKSIILIYPLYNTNVCNLKSYSHSTLVHILLYTLLYYILLPEVAFIDNCIKCVLELEPYIWPYIICTACMSVISVSMKPCSVHIMLL